MRRCSAVVMFMFVWLATASAMVADIQTHARINVIPFPQNWSFGKGEFILNRQTMFHAFTPEARLVANFYAQKMRTSTGLPLIVGKNQNKNIIRLLIEPNKALGTEGYELHVSSNKVVVKSPTAQGLFYGMASVMQLLPPEIESSVYVKDKQWSIPAIEVEDAPRFSYRGLMIDVVRHFITIEELKKQIDVLASFKINRLHLHLSDYQGWRVEIKKYPRLTEVGSKRIDEYGKEYKGFYTQEEIRGLVKYAADRFITIIPEIDVPAHSLAAIASYPELSCTGKQYSVMSRWGRFPVILCPGKEVMFKMLDGIFEELSQLFPCEYVHIGADECPKEVWKSCSMCQKRIKEEKLQACNGHTAEERLQSYAVTRCGEILKKHGKKMIAWEEALEGGIAPDATIMSWRGNDGGITSALMNHNVIMTPVGGAMYLDYYQGDIQAEPFAWGGSCPINVTYGYNPIPDKLLTTGKKKYVLGVQGNAWTECMYTLSQVEYQVYPRILAVAEVGWTEIQNKNYEDFSRRLNDAAVRLDMHGVNYHIPLPEQPGGSADHIAFIDSTEVVFKTSRPVKMIYTLDGSEPKLGASEYTHPLKFTETGTIKIRSILPSGRLSVLRTIQVEKQEWRMPLVQAPVHKGLKLKMVDNKHCVYLKELKDITQWKDSVISTVNVIACLRPNFYTDVAYYVAVAQGALYIESDGIYYFRSDNSRVWVSDAIAVDNDGKPQVNSKYGRGLALKKGWHQFKVEQISNFIGGWNSQHRNDGRVMMRKSDSKEWKMIEPDQLGY